MHTGLYTKIIRSTPIVFVVFHVTFYTLNINLKIVSHLLIEYHTIIFFIRNTDHVIHNQCLLGQWKLCTRLWSFTWDIQSTANSYSFYIDLFRIKHCVCIFIGLKGNELQTTFIVHGPISWDLTVLDVYSLIHVNFSCTYF